MYNHMNQELKLPKELSVFIDQKTDARTFALPFKLIDGTDAVLMVCRLKKGDWKPEKDITSITITHVKN